MPAFESLPVVNNGDWLPWFNKIWIVSVLIWVALVYPTVFLEIPSREDLYCPLRWSLEFYQVQFWQKPLVTIAPGLLGQCHRGHSNWWSVTSESIDWKYLLVSGKPEITLSIKTKLFGLNNEYGTRILFCFIGDPQHSLSKEMLVQWKPQTQQVYRTYTSILPYDSCFYDRR